jgi:diguanylate cyclase (GGDEF)-like protein
MIRFLPRRTSARLLALPLFAALALGAAAGVFTYRHVLGAQHHALALHREKDDARMLLLLVREAAAAQLANLLFQRGIDQESQTRSGDALRERGRELAAALEAPLLAAGLPAVGAALEHILRVQRQAAQAHAEAGPAAAASLLRDGNAITTTERMDQALAEFIAMRRAALDAVEQTLAAGQLLGFGLMGVSTLGMLGMLLGALAQLARKRSSAEAAHAEMNRRGREVAALFGMGEMLQAAQGIEDVKQVVEQACRDLLPELEGAFYVFNNSRDRLDLLAAWGHCALPPEVTAHFAPGACWALKRGRPHGSGLDNGLICDHGAGGEGGCLCIPMQARGEVYGLLQFHPRNSRMPAPARSELAQALADGVSLALANMALREKLRVTALRDPLTGLNNRRFLEETLPRMVAHAERREASIAVMMLDLDHFKQVNDRHGHGVGDAVLREVGALLTARLRRMDVACRYGGEELLVLLPDCSAEDALRRAEQLCEEVRGLHEGQATPLPRVTTSIGVAVFPEHGAGMEAVIAAADAALYAAKRAGRDRALLAGEAPRLKEAA